LALKIGEFSKTTGLINFADVSSSSLESDFGNNSDQADVQVEIEPESDSDANSGKDPNSAVGGLSPTSSDNNGSDDSSSDSGSSSDDDSSDTEELLAASTTTDYPKVLGVSDIDKPEEENEELENKGEVAGSQSQRSCPFWLILPVAEAAILSVYYLAIGRKRPPLWWVVPIGLAILTYVGDQFIAHRFFEPSPYCNFMWLWSAVGAVLPGILIFFRS
jgi:hypothetical protein